MQVEERLAELGNLLPDIVGKMDRARADVLYELLKDPAATADRLLALRELLPRCNVSALVAGHPKLMLGMTVRQAWGPGAWCTAVASAAQTEQRSKPATQPAMYSIPAAAYCSSLL